MYKLLQYCKKNNIRLRFLSEFPFVRKVYHHYSTSTGYVFYINTFQGDKFLEVFHDSPIPLVEDGFDGGDLLSLPVVKEYYGL